MASNRHLGRIIALQTLYEQDFRRDCQDKGLKLQLILERNINRYHNMVDDRKFIIDLVKGVDSQAAQLDEMLAPAAPQWPISQIARMDRMVLHIGAYELCFAKNGVPPKVVINEAVELAKSFGGENSSKFINGVLGTLLRNIDNPKSGSNTAESKALKTKTVATLKSKTKSKIKKN